MSFGREFAGEWELRGFPVLFRTADARGRGISRHKLFQTTKFPVAVEGIRMDPETTINYPVPMWADGDWTDTAQRLRATLLKFPAVAAGYASAARLYGWPLPSQRTVLPLDVSSADENLRIRTADIRLHRTKLFASQEYFELPILTAPTVFITLGPDLSLPDLVRLGDAAVGNWHGPPQTTIDALTTAVGTKGLRSRPHLRAALDLIRPTVDSPRETDLRLWTRNVGLPEPTVHPKIFCRALNRIVEPDLGYEEERLALEYEGDHHRTSKSQWSRDIERDEAMRAEGWVTFRVTSRTDYALLERKIRQHLGLQPRPRA